MKKILAALVTVSALGAALPAFGADLAARPVYSKAPAVYSPAYDWTGFYIGVNGGYEFSGAKTTDTFRSTATGLVIGSDEHKGSLKGGFGGGQIGYNWQLNNWVVGLETDIEGGAIKSNDNFICAACGPGGALFSQKNTWLGTTRLRAGVLVTPEVLFYVTGGGAYGEIKTDYTLYNTTAAAAFSSKVTKGGFTVGGGIEGMFANNWLARVEYLYVDLGTLGTGAPILAGVSGHHDTFSTRFTENLIRVGISYKFGGPVVAKY